jgi:rhamnogalacturonan endolyase
VSGSHISFALSLFLIGGGWQSAWGQDPTVAAGAPVTLTSTEQAFTLDNGLLAARIQKRTGTLVSLRYHGLEMLAQGQAGANGGYWSAVGRSQTGPRWAGLVRIDPRNNGGARVEISCELHNDPQAPAAPLDADYRYSLGRGEPWLYVYAVLQHKAGFPAFSAGEARYCMKLNPKVFDYLSVDADRRRLMPSGYDWDHGAPLNVKEARRMTTGIHKGEPEHKYDYAAVLSETPAYGWSSTKRDVGLWLINPSLEYMGGGPTKAELTGHLDVNPGGLPTLLNMWEGSHYGGTTISVASQEQWSKVVGPFVLYLNQSSAGTNVQAVQETLWRDALARAAIESKLWPYPWVIDPRYPPAAERASVSGTLVLRDPADPGLQMSNIWVGLSAPDYVPPPRNGYGLWRSNWTTGPGSTNAPGSGFGFRRGGFPPFVDWQRDAKFYQYWSRADANGELVIPHIRAGTYTLHAIADGVLGEFTLTNLTVAAGEKKTLGRLEWVPRRYGRTVWQIGVPDRTAREFRHGDHYWQWGLYFDYPKEFPNDVNFIIGQSDCRRDWNYVQPPRIENRNLPPTSEEEELQDEGARAWRTGGVRSTTWSIAFAMPDAPRGWATLRLAFCGTHMGCEVEAFVNGKSIGKTGPLPSTSAMQRDGIRAYWIETPLGFDAQLLEKGTNVVRLLSHAETWSQGVMYDCVRLELNEAQSGKIPGSN